jgi:hypothetical protein
MMTSAKTNANVNTLFQRLSERVLYNKLYGGTSSSSPMYDDSTGPEDAYGKDAPPSHRVTPTSRSNGTSSAAAAFDSPAGAGAAITNTTDNKYDNKKPEPMTKSAKSRNRRLDDSIEECEMDGGHETFKSGESNDTHYSRCDGLMSCDVGGSSTAEADGPNCTIQ